MSAKKKKGKEIFSFLNTDRKYTNTEEGHRSVQLFNILAFSFIIFYVLTGAPFLLTDASKVGLAMILESGIFAVSLIFSKKGHFLLAKNAISIALTAGVITLGGVLGPDGFAHILFFPLVIALFIIFNKYETANRNFYIVISLVQFFIMEFYPVHYYSGPPLSHESERLLEFWIFLISFVTVGGAVYYFLQINFEYRSRVKKYLNETRELNKELTEQSEQIRNSVSQLSVLNEKLKSNERRFRFISENSKDIITLVGEDCIIQYASPSIKELLGYEASYAEGKNVDEFIHKKDIDRKNEIVQNGKGELRLIAKNKKPIWFEIVLSDVKENDFKGYQLSVRDISDRKRVESELKSNRSLIERIAETTPNFLYVFHHKEKKISYLNRSIWEYLGYKMDSLFRMDLENFNLIHPDDKARLEKNHATLTSAKEGIVITTEYRMKNASGKWIWFESRDTALEFSVDGSELVLSLGEARDITENKENEAFLLKKQEELKLAKQKAEEASEVKAQFLSTMSHEIRTPLNSVIGMTNLLISDNPKEEQMENLRALSFGAKNLMALINDILDFSKIEAGRIRLEKMSFNLIELAQNTIESFKVLSKEKDLRIILDISKDVPEFVLGDPTRLSQILNNLMGNAIKFTHEGHVSLNLSVNSKTEDIVSLVFRVEDTGIGIPENKQEIIFESFSQASSETTRKYGGTGLGLAITKKLVDLQQGTISLSSQPGKGTEFRVELPYKLSDEGKSLKTDDEDEETNLEELKLLLVEDNKMNQLVARKFLTKWGIDFDIAENGIEALDKIRTAEYNVVLMDLHMPEMDGYQATREIRKMDNHKKDLPVIALSASTGPGAEEKMIKSGMNDFVAKPFDPTLLFNAIKRNSSKYRIKSKA